MTAAVSCGISHASAVSTPLQWILKNTRAISIIKLYKKLVTHVEPHVSAVSLLKRAENIALYKRSSIHIYLSLHRHHQNDFCIKMGSDESHFNVSVGSDGQSHKAVSTNHNLFEEKENRSGIEPRSFRLPLTLTPYR